VLRLVAMGRTTDEIAVDLRIARLTARNHINNLERKLGARSRVEAVVLGAHHGLI
jgi:DNA-binding CsgD family transcriptional regulator